SLKIHNIMIPLPLYTHLNTTTFIQQNTPAPDQSQRFHGPGFPIFLQQKKPSPFLQIGNGQDGMVMVLRQADPQVINELLMFMMDKNWLAPSSDLNDFMIGKNEEIEERKLLPKPETKRKSEKENSGKTSVLYSKNPFL